MQAHTATVRPSVLHRSPEQICTYPRALSLPHSLCLYTQSVSFYSPATDSKIHKGFKWRGEQSGCLYYVHVSSDRDILTSISIFPVLAAARSQNALGISISSSLPIFLCLPHLSSVPCALLVGILLEAYCQRVKILQWESPGRDSGHESKQRITLIK